LGLTYAELRETPLGLISFVAGDQGLQRVAFKSIKALKNSGGEVVMKPSLEGLQTLSDLMQEMNAFFYGLRKSFSIDVDWGVLSGFQLLVLKRTAEIPYGEVTTYGQLAEEIGRPKAARAVGRALGANPMPLVIPCHRVIGAGGLENKAYLLTLEGHRVKNGKLLSKAR